MADDGTSAEPEGWDFTLTDLEPVPATRVGRAPGASCSKNKAVDASAEAARESVAESNDTQVAGDDFNTVVESGKRRRSGVLGSEASIHESLSAGTLSGAASKPVVNKGQTIVERYVIEDSIASGGMGRVHRVKHLHLGKKFALKQIHDSFSSDESFRAKFYQEARLASGLSHRNIVSIVDFGEDPQIGLFMVMELVEGEPLTRRLRNRERLPLRMACEIILQVADALHYIHKKGIVHGDIKPDNILLRRAGRSEMRRWDVCLLDFGLARPHHHKVVDDEHIEGTPAYMAPELICGKPLSELSDVYSLGILAYHLLAGCPPFQGELRQLMAKHLQDPPAPLSSVIDEAVDERLEALVMKALQKDPKNRQASMAAFLFEMKTLMDMLGFGRRRHKKGASLGRTAEIENVTGKLSRMAFEQCGFGVAVIEGNGDVAVANAAFERFFRWDPSSTKTRSLLDPRFVRIHPNLLEDLEKVASTGRGVRRFLTFKSRNDEIVELIFSLSALDREKDKLLLSIVPIV